MASKYDKLKAHLLSISLKEWHASFSKIEGIVGFTLPAAQGASNYRISPWVDTNNR